MTDCAEHAGANYPHFAMAPLRAAMLLLCFFFVVHQTELAGAQNWDRFRGPNGSGQGDARTVPAEWKAANYLWKQPLAGLGHSSPVVWGDRIFVTSADPQSAEQIVTGLNATTGSPLWERRFPGAAYPHHVQNSFATCTPAVDPERLYFLWRAGETVTLTALTHEGRDNWQCEVSKSTEPHGYGASPVLVGGMVCVINDNEVASNLTGIDQKTSEIRWQVSRPTGQSGFSTPCLLDGAGGKKLLVTASTGGGLTVVDPTSGKTAWQMLEKDLPQRCVSSPIVAGGLILISCGLTNNGLHLIAVKPGAGNEPPQEVYRIKENVPNVPTPIVVGELLFLWHDGGSVACHELATGQRIWRQRVGGNFNSSPICVGNRLYCTSRAGEMVVLAADKKYQLLARFQIGEAFSATPAVAHDRIFLRSEESLMCVGEVASASQ